MNYVPKSYKEILLKELEDALEQGLISHADDFMDYIKNRKDISNFYVMNLSVEAVRLDEVYDDMTLVYNSNKLGLAENWDLDGIGEYINCPRPLASKSGVELTFTLNYNPTNDLVLPEGLLVTGDKGVVFKTVDELYFPEGVSISKVYAYSTITGTGSKVNAGSLTKIISKLSNFINGNMSVTNVNASSGGEEEYTDDEYRELLSNWILTNQKGNDWAYRNYFANLDGLDGYKIVPNWDGSGTVKIIVDPGDEKILEQIYDELNSWVTQETEDIYLTAPDKIKIDVSASINIDIDVVVPWGKDKKDEVKAKVKNTIKLFIDGGYRANGTYYKGMSIGEDFIPHKLSVFLDSEISELKNIGFNYPNRVISVSDEEQCFCGDLNIVIE